MGPAQTQTFFKLQGLSSYQPQSLMQRLPKPTLVLQLLVLAVTSIVPFFMIDIVYDLSQVSVLFFFVLIDNSNIPISCRDIRQWALLAFPIQIRIFFARLTQTLTRLTTIPNITISNRGRVLLSFGVLLVIKFFVFQWPIVISIMCVSFLCPKKGLLNYLNFHIYCLFDKRLQINQIAVFFIQLGINKRPQAISKIRNQKIVDGSGNIVKLL